MKNLWTSIARTLVPALVGFVLAWLATTGLEVDPEFATALSAVLFLAFETVYYVGARLLEKHVSPKFGWLLGVAKAPEYDAGAIPKGNGKHRAELAYDAATGAHHSV